MASFTDIFLDVTKNGHKIPKENYLTKGKYPIIDQGQEYINPKHFLQVEFERPLIGAVSG